MDNRRFDALTRSIATDSLAVSPSLSLTRSPSPSRPSLAGSCVEQPLLIVVQLRLHARASRNLI